jgi:hypothetical protein
VKGRNSRINHDRAKHLKKFEARYGGQLTKAVKDTSVKPTKEQR